MWLVMLLPVITAGASFTAMSRMMFNIREEKPAGVVLFYKTFAEEFGKSTLLWLIALILPAAVLALYLFTEVTSTAVLTLIFAAVVLWLLVFLYAFPLNAFFDNTVGTTLKNSMMMSLSYLKYTVPALAISMLPVFVYMLIGKYYFLYSVPVWIFILLPLMEYWKSYFFLKVFYEYVPEERRLAFSENEPEK